MGKAAPLSSAKLAIPGKSLCPGCQRCQLLVQDCASSPLSSLCFRNQQHRSGFLYMLVKRSVRCWFL